MENEKVVKPNQKRIWKRRRLRFCRALGFASFFGKACIGVVLIAQPFIWLFTSPWREVRGVLILALACAVLLVPVSFLIARIEHSLWHLPTLMLILITATIVLVMVALELGLAQ